MENIAAAGTPGLCLCGAELPPKASEVGRPRTQCDACRKVSHKSSAAKSYAVKRSRVQEKDDSSRPVDEAEGVVTRKRFAVDLTPPPVPILTLDSSKVMEYFFNAEPGSVLEIAGLSDLMEALLMACLACLLAVPLIFCKTPSVS